MTTDQQEDSVPSGADERGAAETRRAEHAVRRRILLAVLAALAGAAVLHYYAYNNWSFHGRDWAAANIDESIQRGLAYLHETGSFARGYHTQGEHRVHHWFLEKVLARADHAGLRRQMRQAAEVNRRTRNWTWRAFTRLPGCSGAPLSPTELQIVQHNMEDPPDNIYHLWFLYALHPDQLELPREQRLKLFDDTGRLSDDYDLTHALMCYLWLQQRDPQLARELDVARLIGEVNGRLLAHHRWDACASDIYNERVAFWLYMNDRPPVRPRWIERIMASQNSDGGWTFDRYGLRTVVQLLGMSADAESHPHPTLMALYALVEYREWLREQGLYRAGVALER